MVILLILVVVGCLLWCFFIEPWFYAVNRHEVRLSKTVTKPLKILHLTDTHYFGSDSKRARFFEKLAKEDYDFIFITGDIFDHEEGVVAAKEELKKFKAKHGVFAVFGNHDYYEYRARDVLRYHFPRAKKLKYIQPTESFQKSLEEIGIRVLRNEVVKLNVEGNPLTIHGLDDPVTGHANIRTTLQDYEPDRLHILLTHSADAFLNIGKNEIDLSFSGHTHGGQIRLPWFGAIVTHSILGRSYVSGIQSLKGAVCSISRGLGTSRHARLRFLCRPEAVILNVMS